MVCMIAGLAVCTIALLPIALKSLRLVANGEGIKETLRHKQQ